MPIPEDTLKSMESAAKRATPGPWERGSFEPNGCGIFAMQGPLAVQPAFAHGITDGDHIAASNPAKVLALIAAYREQGRELAAARQSAIDEIADLNQQIEDAAYRYGTILASLTAQLAEARECIALNSTNWQGEEGGARRLALRNVELGARAAALTAERDEARAKTEEIRGYWQKAIRQRAKEVPATTAMVRLSDAMRVDCEAECAPLTALLKKAGVVVSPFLEWISDELKVADEMQPDLMSFDDECEVDPDDLAHAASINPLKWGDFRKLRTLRAEIEAALQPKETPND